MKLASRFDQPVVEEQATPTLLTTPTMATLLTTTLPPFALELIPEIESALSEYLHPRKGCPPALQHAMAHSLLAPGKRLRPLLTLLATHACGLSSRGAMPAACAIEMVHTYSLIHDDLPAMDDDDLRRGRPSCHAAFGEATAILAGDALLTLAFEILAKDLTPPVTATRCILALARAAGRTCMVGGQADDLAASEAEHTADMVESIHLRKTAAMIVAALEMGNFVAEGTPSQLASLQRFGRSVGLAFQIIDDLLDEEGEEADLGKRTRQDAKHDKLTYPSIIGVEASRARARTLTAEAFESLQIFGDAGRPLVEVAEYLLRRKT